MISFPELGKIGRLGNHLFQIAATVGAAMDHADEWGLPRWAYEKQFPMEGRFHDAIPSGPIYKERRFAYDPIPYEADLRLSGYFQSEKYFERHTQAVRRHLTPLGMPSREAFKEFASVQIRRGDYLQYPDHHPILPIGYYREAMDLIRSAGTMRFLVFSDDLKWCRDNFREPGAEVISDTDPMGQFKMTVACRHHVMANSTFSWWSAWLDPAPDKIVVAPKLWFGPGYSHYGTSDLYARGWIVV